MEDDEAYRKQQFESIAIKRDDVRRYVKEHSAKLDELGYSRYRKDQKDVDV